MNQIECADSADLSSFPFHEYATTDMMEDDDLDRGVEPQPHGGASEGIVPENSSAPQPTWNDNMLQQGCGLSRDAFQGFSSFGTSTDLQSQFPSSEEFAMDEFFRLNGAFRPVEPCTHCSRLRLQCFSLYTTPDNPNPTTACSSCVALFQPCSLAGPSKRQASAFETPQPVVGNLHGVYEGDPTDYQHPSFDQILERFEVNEVKPTGKRSNSRSGLKTRPLRQWMANHPDHPYPSDQEKEIFVQTTGLSLTQILNWFSNARRRQRHAAGLGRPRSKKAIREGSPAPRDSLSTSPLSRWRNSPPEEEPASMVDIENALMEMSQDTLLSTTPDDHSIASVGAAGAEATSSTGTFSVHDSSSELSVYLSQDSNSSYTGTTEGVRSSRSRITTLSSKRGRRGRHSSYLLQCSFCGRSFTKKSDWVRHERSVHLPGLDAWVCSDLLPLDAQPIVWCVGQSKPRCSFCGEEDPGEEHLQSHEFSACAERSIADRTFYRKDHLWQHLVKFHGCVKWEHWALDSSVDKLRQSCDAVDSTCGFCFQHLNSWKERASHLVSHFKAGATIADWIGGHGIHEPWGALVQSI
ncbi:hypothetical protein BU24DRAFT_419079 [Aaosphaeria arxii CBS 175.79]|uniref:Homeobox and C2H2 transcription factor n=1 Tax=Aaosphaeria arxii CBS 175.79 TaxID=1450172 RepID=A0A6A5Y2L0_9PLEO|nr:uncharacterized protein BU24DRAFT_419079 [Aaosphaeria arxii CBS 175.79]KAF2019463.1 hypothetical protein BU24DRAFT_419079 [Aaosphaeria arxii CBS 175.79]